MPGIAGVAFVKDKEKGLRAVESMGRLFKRRMPVREVSYLRADGAVLCETMELGDLACQIDLAGGTEKICVVMDAAILNHENMANELETAPLSSEVNGRHELVAKGYEKWGTGLFRRLEGPWAICVWNAAQQELILARDRFGERPLYFCHDRSSVFFASEIPVLLQALSSVPPIDYDAIHGYLWRGFVSDNRGPFQGVLRVEPGTCVIFDGVSLQRERYWSISFGVKKLSMQLPQALEQADSLMRSAVRRRLEPEQEHVGLLSGGVDSGLIMSYACRLLEAPLKTLNVAFDEKAFDETPFALLVSRACRSRHLTVHHPADALQVIPELVELYGEPYGDYSGISMLLALKAAKSRGRVILTGDGGDECFAGYLPSQLLWLRDIYRRHVPHLFRWPLAGLLASGRFSANRCLRRGAYLAWAGAKPDEDVVVEFLCSGWNSRQLHHLLKKGFRARLELEGPEARARRMFRTFRRDALDRYHTLILERLTHSFTTKVDRVARAVGVEVRSPFLDHRIMEWTSRLPYAILLRRGTRKFLLKHLALQNIPHGVVFRPKKGFRPPLSRWLCAPETYRFIMARLSEKSSFSAENFSLPYIRRVYEEHLSGRSDHSLRLWSMLFLEAWHGMFVRGLPPAHYLPRESNGVNRSLLREGSVKLCSPRGAAR